MQIEGNPPPSKHPDFGLPPSCPRAATGNVSRSPGALADIVFDWRLERLAQGGTRIAVHVEVPDAYTLDLDGQKAVIGMSLRQLADVAAGDRTAMA